MLRNNTYNPKYHQIKNFMGHGEEVVCNWLQLESDSHGKISRTNYCQFVLASSWKAHVSETV